MVCNLKYNLENHASAASTNNNKEREIHFFSEIFKNMIEIKASLILC